MKDSGNEALIRRFYEAFRALDADTMQACYCADAAFDDPAFSLRGRDEIGACHPGAVPLRIGHRR